MISQILGKLVKKTPTEIIVQTGGIGFQIFIPFSTFEVLPAESEEISLFIHMVVREDAILLFGFASENEKEMFKQLISISGIGPKIAQTILSGITSNDLKNYISNGDVNALVSIPGVGKKTAERIIIELKDKNLKSTTQTGFSDNQGIKNEALNALLKLGFQRQLVEKNINDVISKLTKKDLTIENILKQTLKNITS